MSGIGCHRACAGSSQRPVRTGRAAARRHRSLEINADEAATLRANIASPEAFRAAGLDYNPALTDLAGHPAAPRRWPLLSCADQRPPDQRSLRRPDPGSQLGVRTHRARLHVAVRPADLRQAAPHRCGAGPHRVPRRPHARSPRDGAAPPARRDRRGAAGSRRPPPQAPASRQPAAAATASRSRSRAGDTAGKIAAANKPANVSLDQMLVALAARQPGCLHRRQRQPAQGRRGARDTDRRASRPAVGCSEPARPSSRRAATSTNYRRRLAAGMPDDQGRRPPSARPRGKLAGPGRGQASRPPPSPDKLTLSKGAVQGQGRRGQDRARNAQAKDAAARVAELNKNITDLNKLSTAAPGSAPPPRRSGHRLPAPALPLPRGRRLQPSRCRPPGVRHQPLRRPRQRPAPVASRPAAAAAPAPTPHRRQHPPPAPAAATAAAPPRAPAAAATPPPPGARSQACAEADAPPPDEPSFVDELLDNPLVLAAAGA